MHAANSNSSEKAFPKYETQGSLCSVSSLFRLERSNQNAVVQKKVMSQKGIFLLLF